MDSSRRGISLAFRFLFGLPLRGFPTPLNKDFAIAASVLVGCLAVLGYAFSAPDAAADGQGSAPISDNTGLTPDRPESAVPSRPTEDDDFISIDELDGGTTAPADDGGQPMNLRLVSPILPRCFYGRSSSMMIHL